MVAKNKGVDENSLPLGIKLYPHIVPSSIGRWYQITSDPTHVVPSSSTIPSLGLPTQPFLLKWKIERCNGNYQSFLNLQSFESRLGAGVHELFERYVVGEVVDVSSNDISEYIDTEAIHVPNDGIIQLRKGFQSCVRFWEHNSPELLGVEELAYSTRLNDDGSLALPFCGRIDIIARIDGKTWILDVKTSKTVKDVLAYQVQLNIYKMLYEDMTGMKIDGIGIIHANKTFANAEPPKSVLNIIKYKVDEELVWDTYKMFMRCSDFNLTHHKRNAQAPLVYGKDGV